MMKGTIAMNVFKITNRDSVVCGLREIWALRQLMIFGTPVADRLARLLRAWSSAYEFQNTLLRVLRILRPTDFDRVI
jgi:hypothetical protein